MEPTWWVRFWRWAVALQGIVGVTGSVIAYAVSSTFVPSLAWLHTPPEQLLSAAYLVVVAAIASLLAITALVFTVPIWLVVELHAWWRRRRELAEWRLYARGETQRWEDRNRVGR
jgi:hypothetical protein